MDTFNFGDFNASQGDILKATAENSKSSQQSTQNIEGFGDIFSVDTYQNMQNTEFGSSGNEMQVTNTDTANFDNFQNFDFSSYQNEQPINDILSNLQTNNQAGHESIEPYVDPSNEFNADYFLNQNQKTTTTKTTTTTTTTNAFSTTSPSGLTKEEEQNILNLLKNQPPQDFTQVNQKVNIDSLPTEVVYLDDYGQPNQNNPVNIVSNDVISQQIRAQTSGLESPIIDTGLTLGNLESFPEIGNDFGPLKTTKVETKQTTTTTYNPTIQPTIPVSTPPINLGNLAPLPTQNVTQTAVGEYPTTTKVDGMQSMYVPPVNSAVPAPVRPLIIKQRPPLTAESISPIPTTGPGVGLQIGEYQTTTKIDGKESIFMPNIEPNVPLTTSTIVKVPKVQQVVVPKVQKVVVPSKKIIIKRSSVSPSRIPLATTTTTTALPVTAPAIPPPVVPTPVVTAQAIPPPIIPTTSTVRMPYSILSTSPIATTQIPVQSPAVITPPTAPIVTPPPPIRTIQTRVIPPPPAPLTVATPPISTIPVTTSVISPPLPTVTLPPNPVTTRVIAPTPVTIQPPAVTTMTIPKVLPPPTTAPLVVQNPAIAPKVIPAPATVPLATTIQKPVVPVVGRPLPYSVASQIPYSTSSQIPYGTTSQPVVVPNAITTPAVATIPQKKSILSTLNPFSKSPAPMQNLVIQPQIQTLPQLRYVNSNYPMVGRNLVPTNMNRPTAYRYSTFRPMARGGIVPINNQLTGIGMVPANMNAPLAYNTRTYNARRL